MRQSEDSKRKVQSMVAQQEKLQRERDQYSRERAQLQEELEQSARTRSILTGQVKEAERERQGHETQILMLQSKVSRLSQEVEAHASERERQAVLQRPRAVHRIFSPPRGARHSWATPPPPSLISGMNACSKSPALKMHHGTSFCIATR